MARETVSATDEPTGKPVIPLDWGWVAAILAGSVAVCAFVSLTIPPVESIILSVVGICVALAGGRLAKRERKTEVGSILLKCLAWVTLLVPMTAAGLAIGIWAISYDLDWRLALASILAITALSTGLLSGRIAQQVAVQLACWTPIALLDGSLVGISALTIGAIAVVLVALYQSRVHRVLQEKVMARERIRNRAEDILRDYEETGQGWFWETDRRGLLTYLSSSVMQTLGKSEDELVQRPFLELFDLDDETRDGERTLTFHLSARSSFQELGVRANSPGEERWWSVSGRPAYDGFGNFVGFRGSGTDLTEKKRNEENVTRLAQYDSLTGLANRFQMSQTLEKILNAPNTTNRECAVFLLDLDRFKNVNDSLGHPAGDALLKQVAQRLERTVGKDGRVGRLGGDEFEVIIPGRTPQERLGYLASEIIHSLSQPYSIEGQRVVIGASVGIAVSLMNGMSSEEVIRNADLALYAAKDAGRGRYHFYSNDLHSAAEERSRLEEALRDAIANGDLELFYQPVVHADDDRIAGFEALLRWNHPTQGWLSPAKFIPIAEDAGLIAAIGEWAIRVACRDLARWPSHIRCAVNVSPLQFANPQLPTIVTQAIAQAQIDPSRLELEITESVFLDDNAGTDAMFTALKRVGVRLALDDFGTGYSSLGYLKKAPFDKIKIDQSFVRGATQEGSRNGAIIESITSLAKSLGMDTTAEGVETLDELELIRKLGCSHVQGYIYSKAIDSESATGLLASGSRIVPQGPRSARPSRQTMLRKVVLEHRGQCYDATIRNMSYKGALIEGLWNVPPGTEFNIAIGQNLVVQAISIWSEEERLGVRFTQPLSGAQAASILPVQSQEPEIPSERSAIRREA